MKWVSNEADFSLKLTEIFGPCLKKKTKRKILFYAIFHLHFSFQAAIHLYSPAAPPYHHTTVWTEPHITCSLDTIQWNLTTVFIVLSRLLCSITGAPSSLTLIRVLLPMVANGVGVMTTTPPLPSTTTIQLVSASKQIQQTNAIQPSIDPTQQAANAAWTKRRPGIVQPSQVAQRVNRVLVETRSAVNGVDARFVIFFVSVFVLFMMD